MLVACIVGARRRSSEKEKASEETQSGDRFLVETLIKNLRNRYPDLFVISYACDDGIGKIAKDVCVKTGIKFGEIVWYFHGPTRWETSETSIAYLKRNATAHEMGDIFAVLAETPDNPNSKRKGMVEDLVDRLRKRANDNDPEARPFVVLDETGQTLEGYKETAIL